LVLHALRRHRTPRSLRVFFTAPATTELHPLSLHDALPIFIPPPPGYRVVTREYIFHSARQEIFLIIHGQKKLSTPQHSRFLHKSDRKSTRLNSSHVKISYAVFCLKKKKHRKPHTKNIYYVT